MRAKTMLVGMTHIEADGERHEQMYGAATSVDQRLRISLRLAGTRSGETFQLPPDLRAIVVASPGAYRLRSTAKIVENPNVLATWSAHPRGE